MVALGGGAVDERAVRAMADAIVHRGPDSEGVFADGPVALAARRLAIIDLARGDQPMRSEDGAITVVQNGELYEHRAVQADLERRGHRFTSHCDTEVLPHLYEERGVSFAEGLRGMFAIALWDARERRLVLARDPFGIKPLYYRVAGGVLSFASELKARVRQPGFAGEVDLEALDAYLAFNSVPGPMSIYRDVRKLPAGHVLEAGGGGGGGGRGGGGGAAIRAAGAGGPPGGPAGAGPLLGDRASRAAARLGAGAPRVRRAGRGLPGGRDRLVAARGARRRGIARCGVDVLDRLRGAVVRRAVAGADGRVAVRDRPSRARAATGRGGAAAGDRGGVRRAVRRFERAAHVRGLAAGVRAREGRDLGRGRRRTVRRLLHVCRGRPRGAIAGAGGGGAGAAGRRAAPELVAACVARVQGQALRPRGGAAAARAAPRVEGDLLAGGAGGVARAGSPRCLGRPARVVAGAIRRDQGRGAARAAAGRRRRDVPRRRPAREDRPGEHGALARGPRAVPGPGRRGARAGAADVAEGPRVREEATAAPRRGRPGAARDRARPEARLLDPGGGVAARRAAPVRAGPPVAGGAAPRRLLPARGGDAPSRRARVGPGGPLPAAVGALVLPAVAADRGGRRLGVAAAPETTC